MLPTLYICSPWRTASLDEVGERWTAIKKAIDLGYAPIFAPWLYRSVADTEQALVLSRAWVSKCDAFLVVGDNITDGMKADIEAWDASWWPPTVPGRFTLDTLPKADTLFG